MLPIMQRSSGLRRLAILEAGPEFSDQLHGHRPRIVE
jgi:hypothetical protein